MAKVVGLQIYPKCQMFWSLNVCRSHSNQVDSNWLQENVGQNLTNIQKESTNPKIYRGLNRAVKSFVARACTSHLVTQPYSNRFN